MAFDLSSGSARGRIGTRAKSDFTTSRGDTFFFPPGLTVDLDISPSYKPHWIILGFLVSAFEQFLDDFGGVVSPRFLYRMERNKTDPIFDKYRITPEMHLILDQMENCCFHGSLKRLYFEGKALELAACLFEQLDEVGKAASQAHRFDKTELERLRWARQYVEEHFVNPPSIRELSCLVGMNMTKLKTGFHELSGETIFELVRDMRMERARCLLEEGDKNVTQTAYEVGYRSLSHFALAFRKRFGCCPKTFGLSKRAR